ncbi:MAG TPA: hypothetical protein DCM05_02550 [Elusimicrobia bacterium]|nr:hypothetical protein [Elusimicrobiota bacterium]
MRELPAPYRLARSPAHEAASLAERHEAGECLSHTLSPDELAQFKKLKVPKRRRDWLAGRLAAKKLLLEMLAERGREARPHELPILNRKDGAPYLAFPWEGEPAPFLSLSHAPSGAVAAAVAGGRRIGVDAEAVAERPEAFVTVFAHPSERAGLRSAHDQTRLWTLKESVLKLLCLGLSVDLWDVRFLEADPQRLELHGRALACWESLGRPAIRVESRPSEHEVLSLAYTGETP